MPETEGEQLASAKEVTIPADPPAFDRAALESTVSDKMSQIFADGDDVLADAAATETAEAKPAEEAVTPAEGEQAVESTEGEQVTEEAAAKTDQAEKPTVGKANPAEPVIPAAYRRSLKAYEWTDEEIDAAAKADPAGFQRMAAKLHTTRNEETRRMSDLGRQIKAQEAAAQATVQTAKTTAKFDAKALRDKYGDEPFIAAMEAQAAQLEQAHVFISKSQERQAAAEMESLGRQIDGFFSSKDMTPYHDQYGKAAATLTDKQTTTRQKVLETADLLISGARAMGRNLTLEEALTTAHDSVSGPIRETAARTKIVQQVKTRTNAITLRPGAKPAAAPSDRTALQGRVKAGLAAAFK